MALKHPHNDFKVRKRDHPGSQHSEIENEPDWGSSGHEHYIGYKNAERRRPGYVEDTADESHIDLKKAQDDSESTKQKAKEGHLVSWEDAIKSEQVSSCSFHVRR
jgi:nitrate reductase (NAD(P)H)